MNDYLKTCTDELSRIHDEYMTQFEWERKLSESRSKLMQGAHELEELGDMQWLRAFCEVTLAEKFHD